MTLNWVTVTEFLVTEFLVTEFLVTEFLVTESKLIESLNPYYFSLFGFGKNSGILTPGWNSVIEIVSWDSAVKDSGKVT
jgi:hypothetical protein